MDSYLDKIVQCPKCHKDVRDGDTIWLDGECLCPDCYKHKRQSYDDMYKKGYNDAKNKYKKYMEE